MSLSKKGWKLVYVSEILLSLLSPFSRYLVLYCSLDIHPLRDLTHLDVKECCCRRRETEREREGPCHNRIVLANQPWNFAQVFIYYLADIVAEAFDLPVSQCQGCSFLISGSFFFPLLPVEWNFSPSSTLWPFAQERLDFSFCRGFR